MGRRTLESQDNVLKNKLKNLVDGAIKRARQEKGEPTITYELFVQELDEGDSFTTTMIDLLVKEMAERQMRPNPIDRHLISERTARTLRLQSSPMNVYRARSSRLTTRRVSASEYLAHPPEEMDVMEITDTEDEVEVRRIDGTFAPEGVRLNGELHDAYLTSSYPSSDEAIPRLPEYVPVHELEREIVTSPRPLSPPTIPSRAGFWPPGASNHARLMPVRRALSAGRNRAMDFNDFTTRRRSAIRQNYSQDGRAEENPDGAFQFGDAGSRQGPFSFTSLDTASRRLFPFPNGPRRRRAESQGWLETPESEPSASTSTLDAEEPSPNSGAQSSSQLWHSLTGTSSSATLPPSFTRRSSNVAVAPRLRRGGVRAPEALVSRFSSSSSPATTRRRHLPRMTIAPEDVYFPEPSRSEGMPIFIDSEPPAATVSNPENVEEAVQQTEHGENARENALSIVTNTNWEDAGQLLTPRSNSPPDN